MKAAPLPGTTFITILAVAVLGCDPSPPDACTLPESLVGPSPPIIPASEVDFDLSSAPNESFVKIAQDAPSFAGLYNDGGWLMVQVADPADEAAAVEAVRSFNNGSYVRGRAGVRTKVVKYSYIQLARWEHAAVVNLVNLGLTGGAVIGNAVREDKNKVGIRVNQGACPSGIARILVEAGIPADALLVEEGYPAEPSYP